MLSLDLSTIQIVKYCLIIIGKKSLGHHAMLCPFHLLHCKFYSELQFGNASNYLENLFSYSYAPLSLIRSENKDFFLLSQTLNCFNT